MRLILLGVNILDVNLFGYNASSIRIALIIINYRNIKIL